MKLFAPKGITARKFIKAGEEYRLFSDFEELKIDPDKLDYVIKMADEQLEVEMPVVTASDYRDYFISGSRARYSTASGIRRTMAMWLALGEFATDNSGKYAEKLMDAVWAIMEESTWIQPAHLHYTPFFTPGTVLPPTFGDGMMHGIDLSAGRVAALLTMVYLLAGKSLDRLTPIVTKKIEYTLHERITKPFLQCPFWWTGEGVKRVNNWGPWCASNILFMTAVIEKDPAVKERVVDRVLLTLDNFLKEYSVEGGCDEGPSYWKAAGGALFDCLETLYDMSNGRIDLFNEPIVRNIGEYILKMNIDGDMFLNFADASPKILLSAELLERYGRRCGSEALISFAKNHYQDHIEIEPAHMYRGIKDICSPAPKKEKSEMPLVSYMGDIKVMTARECGDSSKGTFLGAKCGTNGESHNHNDVGNFVVYRNGNPVIIDTGVGVYTKTTFSKDRYTLWFMQSGYHNLPSFGGVDQKNGADFRSTDESFDEEARSLSAEISAAYPAEAGLESLRRSVRLDGDSVIIRDIFKTAAPTECVFHLMTVGRPEEISAGCLALDEGMTLTYDVTLSLEIEEVDPVGMDTLSKWGSEKLHRIKLSVTADQGDYTFTVSPRK